MDAIPWHVPPPERPRHERTGARALLELLELLPDLRGVLLGASSREVWAHACGMTGRYRHLAHWQGNDRTRMPNAELLTSYRHAVKFAATP